MVNPTMGQSVRVHHSASFCVTLSCGLTFPLIKKAINAMPLSLFLSCDLAVSSLISLSLSWFIKYVWERLYLNTGACMFTLIRGDFLEDSFMCFFLYPLYFGIACGIASAFFSKN